LKKRLNEYEEETFIKLLDACRATSVIAITFDSNDVQLVYFINDNHQQSCLEKKLLHLLRSELSAR